ncbi:hypothetical protein D9Q98_009194 [Chlorella vulgaris]|uniref:Uncharacterized protein n=1 Tax=Chlorella vulgaris TaxID=3077 RepID=A0A9D4YX16_CHLVU|nr:hypothetical protein D9Q98_009194 [Chlorella vulgaris]
MATVAATTRLAAMAGRCAPRHPHRSVAGVSRTGAAFPVGSASVLRNSARRASPLVARVASDDDARSTGGEAEDKPILFACFILYPEDVASFVPMSILATSTLLVCLYNLNQAGFHSPQYWLPYVFFCAFFFCFGVSPTLRIGYNRWLRRERKRFLKRKQQE